MNTKAIFTYTGIRVKDLGKSVKFYTQVLGMKESGRSTIEATKSQVVSLASEEDGPQLELSYYEKGSEFATDDYSVGYGTDHLASKVEDLDKSSFRSQTTRLSLQNSMWKLIRADGLTLLIQMEYTLNYSHKVN